MSQSRVSRNAFFTISEVAADWHELMIPIIPLHCSIVINTTKSRN